MSEIVLQCINIETGYKGTQILWGINLSLGKEEIITILGPNGAGKSTLAKTILGFLKPWKGSIKAFGNDIASKLPHERVKLGINGIPETNKIFPDMNVLENLLLGAYMDKDPGKIKERLEEVFSLFPVLKERLTQKARTLSGGEQQMLAIGRALMTQPKILVLDEPTMGLSPILTREIIRTAERLRKEFHISVILIEEKIKAALSVADRAYLINEGRILYEIPREEFEKYEEVFKKYVGV